MSRIVYLRVEDRNYPRNERIRASLGQAGHDVVVVDRVTSGPKPIRLLRDFARGLRASLGSSHVVVPEFSLPFVPAAWLIARVAGARLVVDAFVGKYETVVEDWGRARPGSLRARWCSLVDRTAARLADLLLIDTDARAETLRSRAGKNTSVFTLPVGSPAWIRPQPRPQNTELRVLYSGGALPLHGIPFFLRGLAETRRTATRLTLVLAAPAVRLESFRALADDLGILDRCEFVEPVSHGELIRVVGEHDVVLGVFGDSPKARTVLANKVWQGLAVSRTVVTRSGPALAEIADIAGPLLIGVPDECALAEALDRLAAQHDHLPDDSGIADRLEAYVQRRFDDFLTALGTDGAHP
ncbi:hypothetical protein [Leifsonia sp. TF02-11]|uniref:hypothetical protein n=1 Tax=Leifsonia sp. TF02-11 TaxID=2815212 RepID=UPI001AA10360|nr:hypothetical protein [Leifsonia sp. TF02-11]MBO1737185.1 hypothetical protein [Leifsonia sp. TF02-11]